MTPPAGLRLPNLFGKASAGISVLALLTLPLPPPVLADPVQPSRSPPSPVAVPESDTVYRGFTKTFTLSGLGWRHGVDFSGTSMEKSSFFGVPPNQMVEKGSVTVRYAYLSAKSVPFYPRLEVDINETPLGLLPSPPGRPSQIRGKSPEQSVTFSIPPYLVTPLNAIRIRVAKDPRHPCDAVYIGPFVHVAATSSVSLSGIRIHFPNRLSDLPLPFLYHAMTGVRTIPFLLGANDRKILEAAGIVASWIGANGENVPLRFPPSVGLPADFRFLPAGNLVLLAAVPPARPSSPIPSPSGPTLALTDNPADPYGKILLVLGRTPDEVRTAALALALGQTETSGSAATVAKVLLPGPRQANDAPGWIDTRRPVRVDRLAPPGGLEVRGTGSVPLRFSLPPDLFAWQRPTFPLRLHYRYAVLPGEGRSRLDLLLNKKFQDSIPLPPGAGEAGLHRLTVPLSLGDLTPFRNVLRLNFNFRSAIPGVLSCTASRNRRLRGTILGDSTLDLRAVPRFVRLPNLRLFPNGGYPFTRYADMSRTAVVLPDAPGLGDIRIFLHLMAFLAEEAGTPGIRMAVATPEDISRVATRNLILIGTYDSNPLLLRYGKTLPQDNPAARSRIHLEGRMEELLRWSAPPPRPYGPEALAAYFKEDRTPLGVVEEDVSPLSPRRVILSLGGVSEQSLSSMDRVLFDPQHYSEIFGQVSVVGPHRIHSFFVPGPRSSLGRLSAPSALRFWFYSHPLGVLLLLLFMSLAGAPILSRILSRLASRRLGP